MDLEIGRKLLSLTQYFKIQIIQSCEIVLKLLQILIQLQI